MLEAELLEQLKGNVYDMGTALPSLVRVGLVQQYPSQAS